LTASQSVLVSAGSDCLALDQRRTLEHPGRGYPSILIRCSGHPRPPPRAARPFAVAEGGDRTSFGTIAIAQRAPRVSGLGGINAG
jgi:hypothetical protein